MRIGLREEILETARKLFAQEGFNNVSMRDIARVLGVSVGNVTYYFKKKEELFETAVLDRAQNPQPLTDPSDMMQLNELFWELSGTQISNAYYFLHYTQLAQISPRVYDIQQQRISMLTQKLERAFTCLRKSGLMEAEEYPLQTMSFIQGLLNIIRSCMARQLLKNEDAHQIQCDYIKCLWSMLYCTLTQKGRQIYLSDLALVNEGKTLL